MAHAPIRLDQFETYLKDHGLSRTKPRRVLYRALASAGPQTAPQLITTLGSEMDRATVYRTLDFFLVNAIAVRTTDGHVELGESFRPHHHHLVCTICGRSQAVDDQILEGALTEAAKRQGFMLQTHQVELAGLCSKCQTLSKSVIQ
ncbi:transcriptional repressor [Candidatus Saccharibacteria bacterium]|nr:transcriptional repressor [Candidatus Saccharibacteria bacterium]